MSEWRHGEDRLQTEDQETRFGGFWCWPEDGAAAAETARRRDALGRAVGAARGARGRRVRESRARRGAARSARRAAQRVAVLRGYSQG